MNTQGDTLTIGSGGLLTNVPASSSAGGMLTAGTPVNSAATLYAYTNVATTINSPIVNNGPSGAVDVGQVGCEHADARHVAHRLDHDDHFQQQHGHRDRRRLLRRRHGPGGWPVGERRAGTRRPAAIVTGITSATQYTISNNVGTGSTTAAGTQLGFPVTQVLGG